MQKITGSKNQEIFENSLFKYLPTDENLSLIDAINAIKTKKTQRVDSSLQTTGF
jgi:hypothetical protein